MCVTGTTKSSAGSAFVTVSNNRHPMTGNPYPWLTDDPDP